MAKVRITPKLFVGLVCPQNFVIMFNIPPNTFCFFFSMHKWNLMLKFCEIIVDIMKYARKMYHAFFIAILMG